VSHVDRRGRWLRDGVVPSLPLWPEDHARAWRDALHAVEAACGGAAWTHRTLTPWDDSDHPFLRWGLAIGRHPALVDAAASVLGPDLLLRNVDVFSKPPGEPEGIAWHVDARTDAPDLDGMVSVWVALTPATAETGAVAYARGSHRFDLTRRGPSRHDLVLDRATCALLDPAQTVLACGPPGTASLHHLGIAHRSGPNRSTARRLAVVARYLAPEVSPETAGCGRALRVRGDRGGAFEPAAAVPVAWAGTP
jgi:non-heme Fe2+,alpha-ketoglutarate-dependent halogenase